MKNLQDVNEDVLYLFEDLAKDLIEQYNGDAEKALQVVLAYSSGHYKQKLASKSMLNGAEGMTSIQMTSLMQRGRLGHGNAYAILKKYWDPRTADHVKNMRALRSGNGVVFDIRAENFEGFLENFERLRETMDRIDFDIHKCTEMPELEEDGGFGGGNWRAPVDDRYGGGNSYGGGGRGGYGRSGGYGGRGDRNGYQENSWGGGGGRGRGGPKQFGGGGFRREQAWRERDNYGD